MDDRDYSFQFSGEKNKRVWTCGANSLFASVLAKLPGLETYLDYLELVISHR